PPVALAGDGRIRLPVDGEEQAAAGAGLCNPAHHDEHVSVRIRVDGAGTKRIPAEPGGIEIGPVVVTRRAAGPGLGGRTDLPADEALHALERRAVRLVGVEVRVPAPAV